MNILLVGNPNVGKSTLFSRMTGVNVSVSNYPGTTVEYKEGYIKVGEETDRVIDVPGVYSLDAMNKAEKVATSMISDGDIIVNVVDATNLERNLNLTLQLMEQGLPVVVALNFWNETKHRGIDIKLKLLREMLGIPVVPVVAITGEGVKNLVKNLSNPPARPPENGYTHDERWKRVGEIVEQVQTIHRKKHTILERIEDLTIQPTTGLFIAVLVLFTVFMLVRFIGEGLIAYVMDPLFELYRPLIEGFAAYLGPGLLRDLLVGTNYTGSVDFVSSLGMLTAGLYLPLGLILPYIIAFYMMLGALEDIGYLPRLSALLDTLLHKVGMHGVAIIPMMLSMGCNVPGALGARILETKRQRFIAITLMAVAIPCMAQTAMVIGLLAPHGVIPLSIVFGTIFLVWVAIGMILNIFMSGPIPETFLEITRYRMPHMKILLKKLYWRVRGFLMEAVPYMFLGVLIANLLFMSGLIDLLGMIARPVVEVILGLPKESVASLLVGIFRKDVAVGMLLPLGLTVKQLIIASVVLIMYFPCLATFMVILKELGTLDTLKAAGIMITSTLIVGGGLNLIL